MITLNTPAPVAHAGILGLGVFRPERVVTNDEICQKIDSNDEWIQERSGIIERRHAGADEHVVSMATAAARKALADAGITADQLDLVMVATVTHRYQTPSASVEVAAALGAVNAAATDTSAACAGFCYGLGIADGMIRSGVAKYILLIGAEKLSEIVDFEDRGTAFLFADGAGAVIVGPTQAQGIGPTIWGADGTQLRCDHHGAGCFHRRANWQAFSINNAGSASISLGRGTNGRCVCPSYDCSRSYGK